VKTLVKYVGIDAINQYCDSWTVRDASERQLKELAHNYANPVW